jgi:hypothetical protein
MFLRKKNLRAFYIYSGKFEIFYIPQECFLKSWIFVFSFRDQ